MMKSNESSNSGFHALRRARAFRWALMLVVLTWIGAGISGGSDGRRPGSAEIRRAESGSRGGRDRRHDRPFTDYCGDRYSCAVYPYIDLGTTAASFTETFDEDYPSATYSVVRRNGRPWVAGHYEDVTVEEVIKGETVSVFHPSVWNKLQDGKLVMIEPEKTTREPKVRLIRTKVWVEGHYEDAP